MLQRTLLRPALGLVAVSGLLLGCSSGDKTIDQAEMEETISAQLAEQFPDAAEPIISCPDDVDAEVGATAECELTVEGDEAVYPVAVEVTELDDGVATFSAEVAEDPK